MAKIYMNIEADSADDFRATLADLLGGNVPAIVAVEPNAETQAAMQEILQGKVTRFADVNALMADMSSAEPRPTVAAPAPAVEPSPASGAAEASPPAKTDEIQLDSAGTVFDETVHTGTTNKDGTWRRKKGAPAVEPGNAGNGATGTANAGAASQAPDSASTADAGPAEDDEFAAFAAAAAEPAAVDVPARVWADADLGKLCNQAAVKLGSPDKVRELISQYAAEGETPHSRNIPADDREAFAVAVETAAGITFAG